MKNYLLNWTPYKEFYNGKNFADKIHRRYHLACANMAAIEVWKSYDCWYHTLSCGNNSKSYSSLEEAMSAADQWLLEKGFTLLNEEESKKYLILK